MKADMKLLWWLIPIAMVVGAITGANILVLDSGTGAILSTVFVVGGLAMGYFNIGKGEKFTAMLIAILFATVGTTFAVISFFEIVTGIIAGIVTYLALVMIPAAIVVALKESKRIAG